MNIVSFTNFYSVNLYPIADIGWIATSSDFCTKEIAFYKPYIVLNIKTIPQEKSVYTFITKQRIEVFDEYTGKIYKFDVNEKCINIII